MAANMLESVDEEEWKARGLSKGDVMFARSLYQRSLIRTHAPICACRGT